jgi:hypothetical protein
VEIAELVLKYVQALVWPLITLTLVYILRAHLRDAFARMTRVETPAGSTEFAVEARDVLNQAESVGDGAGPVPPGRRPRQAHGVPPPAPPSYQPAAPGGPGQVHPQPGQPGSFGPVILHPGSVMSHPAEQRPGSLWRDGFRVARGVADSMPAVPS